MKLRKNQIFIDIPDREAYLYLRQGYVEVVEPKAEPVEEIKPSPEVEPEEIQAPKPSTKPKPVTKPKSVIPPE